MGRYQEVTDRDYELLKKLVEYGTMMPHQAKVVYETDWYHYKRLRVLQRRGYISRRGNYLQITGKGLEALGHEKEVVRLNVVQKKKYAELADVYSELEGSWDVKTGKEVKKKYGMPTSTKIDGMISADKSYALYYLYEDATEKTAKYVQRELQKLPGYGIDRAVILHTSPQTIKMFAVGTYNLKELLMLPVSQLGISILKKVRDPEFTAKLCWNLFPGKEILPPKRQYADLVIEDFFICNLIPNDYVKRKYLQDYINYAKLLDTQKGVIICLEGQARTFEAAYPELLISSVPEEWVVKEIPDNREGDVHCPNLSPA